jgi:trehalose-phosphatase
MSRSLFEDLEEVGRRIAAAPGLVLFLDYDGTLAPLADQPEQAELPEATRAALQTLVQQQVPLTIIGTHPVADLRSCVGLREAIYAGNHGLEISGPDFKFQEETTAVYREPLRELAADLAERLRPIAGAFVQDRGLCISLNHRRVPADGEEELRRIIHSALANTDHPFQLHTRQKVYDIRPRVYWNRGTAVTWIREHLGNQDALPIYVGDDAADEEAFAALPEGVTVKVGCAANSLAQYRVEDTERVREFLLWLANEMMYAVR